MKAPSHIASTTSRSSSVSGSITRCVEVVPLQAVEGKFRGKSPPQTSGRKALRARHFAAVCRGRFRCYVIAGSGIRPRPHLRGVGHNGHRGSGAGMVPLCDSDSPASVALELRGLAGDSGSHLVAARVARLPRPTQ